ncbi:MAG: alpha/beta hydrolase [Pseudomonadota bacterium]
MRDAFEGLWGAFPPKSDVDVIPTTAKSVPAAWLADPTARDDRIVIYLHGGGFKLGSISSHLSITSRLSGAARSRVLALDYRLMPEHVFPSQIDDTVAAYAWLLEQGYGPNNLAFAGDSAGGGLALAALLRLRRDGLPLPACAVAFSPWTDLLGEGGWRDADACVPHIDPFATAPLLDETARTYLAGADPRDPLASPLYGDCEGLPPLLIQVGKQELLLGDSTRFAQNARSAGVEVELEIQDGAFHVWQHAAPEVPEAVAAIGQAGAFIQKHLA